VCIILDDFCKYTIKIDKQASKNNNYPKSKNRSKSIVYCGFPIIYYR